VRGRSLSALMAVLIVALATVVVAARAQPASPAPSAPAPTKPQMRENCPGLVAGGPPRAVPAALRLAAINAGEVGIRYIGHATFVIQSPQGVTIATDYNDFVRPREAPDIATMNHAHSTHYTDHPDPAIRSVLRGWGPSPDQPARHDLQVRDVRVRNVPTNIRTWNGGTERHGNSIFIFEVSGLCIAHLGHLHHTLTQQQLDEIGRVDVVMAPVDGSVTLDLAGMVEVLQALQAPLIIPMHYFGMASLRRFLDALGERSYDVETGERSSIVLSKASLPAKPKVLALPGRAF